MLPLDGMLPGAGRNPEVNGALDDPTIFLQVSPQLIPETLDLLATKFITLERRDHLIVPGAVDLRLLRERHLEAWEEIKYAS